jgi:hypothetical protein
MIADLNGEAVSSAAHGICEKGDDAVAAEADGAEPSTRNTSAAFRAQYVFKSRSEEASPWL